MDNRFDVMWSNFKKRCVRKIMRKVFCLIRKGDSICARLFKLIPCKQKKLYNVAPGAQSCVALPDAILFEVFGLHDINLSNLAQILSPLTFPKKYFFIVLASYLEITGYIDRKSFYSTPNDVG